MKKFTVAFFMFIILMQHANSTMTWTQKLNVGPITTELLQLLNQKAGGMVAEVMNLLLGLQHKAEEDLVAENARWKKELARLTATLNHLIKVRNDQHAICVKLQNQIDNTKNQIAETKEKISDNVATMKKQHEELQALLKRRCAGTTLYIKNLKTNREILGVLTVVKVAIEKFKPTLMQVEELTPILERFGNFINLYANEHAEAFAEIMYDVNGVHARTGAQIGNGHVDNHKGQIHLTKISNGTIQKLVLVKAQLMKIVTDLEAHTQSTMKKQESEEIEANSQAANFEGHVDAEARRLVLENKHLAQFLANLEEILAGTEAAHKRCMVKLAADEKAVQAARTQLKDETLKHEAIVKRIDGEIALFKDVVAIYKQQVLNAAEGIRARMNNYAAEGNFKKTAGYTHNEVTKFEHLEGNVRKTVAAQAAH